MRTFWYLYHVLCASTHCLPHATNSLYLLSHILSHLSILFSPVRSHCSYCPILFVHTCPCSHVRTLLFVHTCSYSPAMSVQLQGTQELFELSSAFENSVVPQEYGTDREDKRRIGSKMCNALLEKIKYDLTITMVRRLHVFDWVEFFILLRFMNPSCPSITLTWLDLIWLDLICPEGLHLSHCD